jgi:hypothetical protein
LFDVLLHVLFSSVGWKAAPTHAPGPVAEITLEKTDVPTKPVAVCVMQPEVKVVGTVNVSVMVQPVGTTIALDEFNVTTFALALATAVLQPVAVTPVSEAPAGLLIVIWSGP